MAKQKVAIVAVETNLVGRMATSCADPERWPFANDSHAEIVGAFVSDLDERGSLKFILRGTKSGRLEECYSSRFIVVSQ